MKNIFIYFMLCLFGLSIQSVQGMPIFVKISSETTITLEVEPSDTVDNVKQKIHDQQGILQSQQILYFGTTKLEDLGTLSDYSIKSGGTIVLITIHNIISVVSGTGFNIKTGTVLGAEGLDLTPSADFSLTSSLSESAAVSNATTIAHIDRSYQFAATTAPFSGAIQLSYQDAELNNLTESNLKLLYNNGSIWALDNSSTNNASSNYVSTTISAQTLNELSLGNTYTVTFDANGGSGTMTSEEASAAKALTTNTFTKTDYHFTGWNTVADGSGTAYADGASYSFAADVTLFAQWTSNTPTIITAPTASDITYGQTLASSTLSGGVASVDGTFAFTTSSTAPRLGTANQGYTFTPADTTDYTTVTGTVSVTVTQATPSITTVPTASSIVYGQTLASSQLNGGVASVDGTFAFTTSSTAPNVGIASQEYTFTPTDATNYISVTETVNVTVTPATEPTKVNCWDTFVFNTETIAWDNTGIQAAEPTKVNCWDTFVFNTTSCAWDNTGTQATEPVKVNSWDNFVFNTTSCSWDNTGTATNTTAILDSLQDSTLTSLSAVITCYPVASATSYRFKIVTSGTNAIRYYVSTTNSFNLTKVPGTLYSTPYAISVAVYIGRSLKTYGTACTVTTPTPYTKIQDAQCGQTLTSMVSGVVANAVTGVTNYRFKVTANGEERILESVSRVFQLSSLVGGALYNTAYTISVATKYNGVWRDYGTECTVRTPSGLTKILDSQCGQTLSSVGYNIVANAIAGVTNYRFKVIATGEEKTIESVSRAFRLTSMSGSAFFNTEYTISVATKYNGVWGDYGSSCVVRTPTGLTKIQDSQCGTTVTSLGTTIVANYIPGATNYRFKVVANGVTRTIERTSRIFQLTSLVGGVVNNTTYTISVATKYNGKWGDDYGDECTVSTPNTMTARVAKPVTTAIAKEKVLDEVAILAYPSPFTTNFKLNFVSSNTATIAVAVYDMTGRQIENRNLTSSEINNLALGDNYPSGVYTIKITQDSDSKTLKVIKI